MSALVMALYAEGRTDERFLPIIAQRTAVRLLSEFSQRSVDVLEPIILDAQPKSARSENILLVARQARGYHLLFVHADADDPSPTRAMQERIAPGFQAVQDALNLGESVCGHLIPVVPVQMTEAWMLADGDALREIIGATHSAQELNIPARSRLVEAIADPKERLRQVLAASDAGRTRRRRQRLVASLYEPLARRIDLDRLALAPSFAQFMEDLKAALIELRFIEP